MKLLIVFIAVLIRRGPQPAPVLRADRMLRSLLAKAIARLQSVTMSEATRMGLLLVLPVVVLFVLSKLVVSTALAPVWYLVEFGMLFFVLSDSRGEDALEEYRIATLSRQTTTVGTVLQRWYGLGDDLPSSHAIFMTAVCRDWHERFAYPLFWYVLLGAPALVLIMILRWLTESSNENLRDMANSFIQALQWPSSRLVALSMGLAGNMNGALHAAMPGLLMLTENVGDYVASVCVKAMGADAFTVGEVPEEALSRAAEQSAALNALLLRALWVWMVATGILLVLFA